MASAALPPLPAIRTLPRRLQHLSMASPRRSRLEESDAILGRSAVSSAVALASRFCMGAVVTMWNVKSQIAAVQSQRAGDFGGQEWPRSAARDRQECLPHRK